MSEAPKPIKTLVTVDPSNPHYAAVAAVSERKRAGVVNQLAAVGFAFQSLGGATRALDTDPAPTPRKAPERSKAEKQEQPQASAPQAPKNAVGAAVEPQSASPAPAVEAKAAPIQQPRTVAAPVEAPAPAAKPRRRGGFPIGQ